MSIKRSATTLAILFLVAFSSACGPAMTATEAPYDLPAPEPTAGELYAFDETPLATQAPPAPDGSLQPPNDQSAEDMFFQNYGVNPSIDTEDDNLSTFSLDVDTGSYTVARRYVNDGSLPPKD